MDLQILPLENLKPRLDDESELTFGKQFSDRMFVMNYKAVRVGTMPVSNPIRTSLSIRPLWSCTMHRRFSRD